VCLEAMHFLQIELLRLVVRYKKLAAPVFNVQFSSIENFGRFVGFLNVVFLVGNCWRVKLSKCHNLIVYSRLVFDVIDQILLDCLSNVCFNLSSLIFLASVFFDLFVVDT
jgi:hypothetical protein